MDNKCCKNCESWYPIQKSLTKINPSGLQGECRFLPPEPFAVVMPQEINPVGGFINSSTPKLTYQLIQGTVQRTVPADYCCRQFLENSKIKNYEDNSIQLSFNINSN